MPSCSNDDLPEFVLPTMKVLACFIGGPVGLFALGGAKVIEWAQAAEARRKATEEEKKP